MEHECIPRSRLRGRGCEEAENSEEKCLVAESGKRIQRKKALVKRSTGKAIQ